MSLVKFVNELRKIRGLNIVECSLLKHKPAPTEGYAKPRTELKIELDMQQVYDHKRQEIIRKFLKLIGKDGINETKHTDLTKLVNHRLHLSVSAHDKEKAELIKAHNLLNPGYQI